MPSSPSSGWAWPQWVVGPPLALLAVASPLTWVLGLAVLYLWMLGLIFMLGLFYDDDKDNSFLKGAFAATVSTAAFLFGIEIDLMPVTTQDPLTAAIVLVAIHFGLFALFLGGTTGSGSGGGGSGRTFSSSSSSGGWSGGGGSFGGGGASSSW